MEMVLTGVQATAQEMADRGTGDIASCRKGEHLSEAVKLAKESLLVVPLLVRLAKQAVLAAFETTLEEGLEIERKNFLLLFATEDKREGMQAYIEKRKANFKGR